MKKFLIPCVLMCLISLCACSNNTQTPDSPIVLESPIVTYNKGLLSWEPIKNATKYELSLNGEIITTYNTNYYLKTTNTPTNYTVQVKSISENTSYLNSAFSQQLIFETYNLSTPSLDVKQCIYSNNRDTVEIPITFSGDYFSFYVNDSFVSNQDSEKLRITNSLLAVGENTIEIRSGAHDSNVCDSDPYILSVKKLPDYENVILQDGKIMCTLDGQEVSYDTSTFPNGESTQLIQNIANPSSQILLSSDGISLPVKKLEPTTVLSFYYEKKNADSNAANGAKYEYIFQFSLNNIGLTYEKIEIIARDSRIINSSMYYTHYCTTVIYENDQIYCSLGMLCNEWLLDTFSIVLYKDGFLSSSEISCK